MDHRTAPQRRVRRSKKNEKNKKHEGFFSEFKQSNSSSRSPIDSKIRTQEIKERKKDKLGKQFDPQWSCQFCYRANC
jgi:hypothetical protein